LFHLSGHSHYRRKGRLYVKTRLFLLSIQLAQPKDACHLSSLSV
jgi:hypothetical protein